MFSRKLHLTIWDCTTATTTGSRQTFLTDANLLSKFSHTGVSTTGKKLSVFFIFIIVLPGNNSFVGELSA